MHLNQHYLLYSLAALFFGSICASIYTSLRFTGDAGLPRLIERNGRNTKYLTFWEKRWSLLCKTVWLFLTLSTLVSTIYFYRAVQPETPTITLLALFFLALLFMLVIRIIPYILSESYADRISLAVLPLVGAFTLPLYPFVWPLQFIEDRLLQHAMSASDEEDRPSAEDEIKNLIEETDEEDLEKEEREIIRSVFEFGDTVVREIMTPRVEISGLKDTQTISECIEQIKESPYSRFPVYHENIDDVIGMIHVKDLLRLCSNTNGAQPISQLVKKVGFVPETMPINDLMQLMKNTHAQMVLVVDEYGGTEGLVSMEDIIEELVGEIEDEYDLNEKEILHRPDGTLLVQARISILDLNEELNLNLPESDEYDSLGGYIVSVLGRIPSKGETLEIQDYKLLVQSSTQRHIQTVQLIPHVSNKEKS